MLRNRLFLFNTCDKTYKKACIVAEKCYILWKKEIFTRIFAAVKNKKASP